ncbi:MAG: hypothetical protein KC438_15935, partial [Thermomicrobiales bacterium]|nr:hypothetical protein [Thermomicrobiales bacterium]
MSSRAFEQPNDELEAQLSALGSRIAWAPTPDLAHAVLASHTQPAPREIWDRRRTWLAVAAILLLLSGTLLASSSIRSTVADFLGIEGLRIELGESVTTPAAHPNLGTPTSMQDFQHWLPFAPMQPDTLGGPDAVYLRVL